MATEIAKGREKAAKPHDEPLEAQNALAADADIYETDESLYLRLDVPGVPKGSVRIEVDGDNVLRVSAKNGFQEPAGPEFREFEPGDFYRAFRLGGQFDKEAVSAKLENGVLEINVRKHENVRPRNIAINA